jgi:NarL family two-component system response regulator LiaR
VVGLMNVGVRGYFDLNESSEQLAEALRVVHKEEIWLPRDKMSSIMDRIISVVGRDLKEKTLDQLTPTEFQVLRLIGQGKSNDEIADAMFISKNTVRSHIKSIYAKLDTHSRLQLALYAINSALF